MKDFNFFAPYLIQSNKISKKEMMIYSFITIIGIVLIAIPLVNQITISKMQNKAIAVAAVAESEEIQKQKSEIDHKKMEIQKINEYDETLQSINKEMIRMDMINDIFIETITDRVPQNVFFQNIHIENDEVEITGVAKNNKSIAEFEQNLREVVFFENVFIPNISLDNVGYSFTISFHIKGGSRDEVN